MANWKSGSISAMGRTTAEVIGANAHRIRLDAGKTLEDMSRAARMWGLSWSSGRVGDFEAGRVAPRLDTLHAAALALAACTGRPVSLADLLDGDGATQIRLNDKRAVDLAGLQAAVSTRPVSGASETGRRINTALTDFAAAAIVDQFRDADRRVCRDLELDIDDGAAVMGELWGVAFSVERDRQAGPNAKPQHKIQVSRRLVTQLREAIT